MRPVSWSSVIPRAASGPRGEGNPGQPQRFALPSLAANKLCSRLAVHDTFPQRPGKGSGGAAGASEAAFEADSTAEPLHDQHVRAFHVPFPGAAHRIEEAALRRDDVL